ncbi:MAG: transcription antitermination factor NusB [Oscillospiraceae bacterium]|jgi:N utilization substance protein B|nr:transcription antitermination factor NusB [Oscillospiraceae bacterium]
MNRHQQREQAFLLLFESMFSSKGFKRIINSKLLVEDFKITKFAEFLFQGVCENHNKIENMIEKNIIAWEKNRLSKVALCVLKIAIFEMIFVDSIPISVSINEAIEIAKKYGTEGDPVFVNGVLGIIAIKLKSINHTA